jgi:hypothetical protein
MKDISKAGAILTFSGSCHGCICLIHSNELLSFLLVPGGDCVVQGAVLKSKQTTMSFPVCFPNGQKGILE